MLFIFSPCLTAHTKAHTFLHHVALHTTIFHQSHAGKQLESDILLFVICSHSLTQYQVPVGPSTSAVLKCRRLTGCRNYCLLLRLLLCLYCDGFNENDYLDIIGVCNFECQLQFSTLLCKLRSSFGAKHFKAPVL